MNEGEREEMLYGDIQGVTGRTPWCTEGTG